MLGRLSRPPNNGPLNGTPRPFGKIVLADDPVAADTTCARLMGLNPGQIVHVREGAKFIGNTAAALIDQVGESVLAPGAPFQVVREFEHLRQHASGFLPRSSYP